MLNCKEGNEKISFRCPLFIHLVELPYSPLGKTPLRIEKIRLQTLIFAVTLHSENKTDTVFVRRFDPYRNDSPFFFVRRSTQKIRRAPFSYDDSLRTETTLPFSSCEEALRKQAGTVFVRRS